VPSRSRLAQGLALCRVRRTPGISCEGRKLQERFTACTRPWRLPPSMPRSSSNRPSSASSPRWAAPTHSFTKPTQPRPSSTPPLATDPTPAAPHRAQHKPVEPGARQHVGLTVTWGNSWPRRKNTDAVHHCSAPDGSTYHARREGNRAGQAPPLSRAQGSLPDSHRGAACRADRAGSGPRALRRPPNTGDKLRRARTPRAVHGLHNTVATAAFHASLQLQPPFVCFIPSLGGAHPLLH
jgi:hypothetical protein